MLQQFFLAFSEAQFLLFYPDNICLHNPDRCPLHVQSTALSSFSSHAVTVHYHLAGIGRLFPPVALVLCTASSFLSFVDGGFSNRAVLIATPLESSKGFLCLVSPAFINLNQRHRLSPETSLHRPVPQRRGSHCQRKEEVVQWKDRAAFGDSRATNDPCRNPINSHYVSAGPVAQQHARTPARSEAAA